MNSQRFLTVGHTPRGSSKENVDKQLQVNVTKVKFNKFMMTSKEKDLKENEKQAVKPLLKSRSPMNEVRSVKLLAKKSP